MRETLDHQPQICRRVGEVAILAESHWIDRIAGDDVFTRECVERTVAEMRRELGGPSPTALLKMAVDRLISAWLAVQVADKAVACGGETIPNANFQIKRQAVAQRHYSAAVKSLSEIRRLLPAAGRTAPGPTTDVPADLQVFTPIKPARAKKA